MSQQTDKPFRNGLIVAGLLTAAVALPAWAAGQSDSNSSNMPATKSQTEMLKNKVKTNGMQQPQGEGSEAGNMPATKSQKSMLRENKHMSHENSMSGNSMSGNAMSGNSMSSGSIPGSMSGNGMSNQ